MGQKETTRSMRPFIPVLGLQDGESNSGPEGSAGLGEEMPQTLKEQKAGDSLELTVVVPARNEAACLVDCLTSLIAQSEAIFQLGDQWELIVVDDHSTDRTGEIARGFDGVIVMEASPLLAGWTGKCNAVWTAAQKARGRWLLFTDADTIHEAGNLLRALHEAKHHQVGLLSYSPRQIVHGITQRSVMPLIFSELAAAYPPHEVSDSSGCLAAANGQFLLIAQEAYVRVGGHRAVANTILEDVELARRVKQSGLGLRFRYAPDALSTRMYRSTAQMDEGWTKNLALLFGNCRALAVWRTVDLLLLLGLPVLAMALWARPISHLIPWVSAGLVVGLLWLRTLFRFYRRVLKSNFSLMNCLLAPVGLPRFIFLLWRSWYLHSIRQKVSWKGRTYGEKSVKNAEANEVDSASIEGGF